MRLWPSNSPRRTARFSGGQAMVEFVLVAPLVFLLLLGTIQLGFLFAGQNGLTNAAREAARYASTLPTPDTIVAGNCAVAGSNSKVVYDRLTDTVSGNLRQYIPGYLPGNLVSGTGGLANCGSWTGIGGGGVTGSGVGYCAYPNADGTYSVRVRVTVLYRHPLFVPLVGRFFSAGDTWQLGAVEEMRVEGPNRSIAGGFTPCP